jgi:hypothetical protein
MERSRKRLMARALAMREALAGRAINAADYRTALAVLDSLAKLQNLFTAAGDVKELARLVADQTRYIRELEGRLDERSRDQGPGAPEPEAAGPAGGPDADPGRPDSNLPG